MQSHRNIIRNRIERRRRQERSSYVEFMTQIIIIQSCIRRYLAKKIILRLQDEEKNAATEIIRYTWNNYKLRKEIQKRISSRIISRFIRNIPFLRERRLELIRQQLSRIRINRFINRLIEERRERRTALIQRRRAENEARLEAIRNRPRLPPSPPGVAPRVNFQSRLNEFIRQREDRIQARDENMMAIRERINTISTNIETNLQRHNAIFRRNNIERNPITNRVIELSRPILRPTPAPPTPLPTQIRPNPITHELPTIQQGGGNRLLDIEREFRDPRMRRIYQENQIYLPTGERILPGRDGGIILDGRGQNRDITFLEPESSIKISCPICMDDVGINRAIKFSCEHSICKICLRNLIASALNNVAELPLKCPLFNSGCPTIIIPNEYGIRQLISENDYNKFERLSILKMHVPDERLKYCPNSQCQMPYELIDNNLPSEPPKQIDFKYFLSCFDCNTHICTYCNDIWHEGMSCDEFQNRTNSENEETSKYIKNYCKKCPNCKVNVQKIQTIEQELYERRTGMAGGTSECHHVTCGNCKRDFCWTCLKMYRGATYYHEDCPNVDCVIDFINGAPLISHLPLGKIRNIKMIIYEDNNVVEEKIFRTNNRNRVLDNPSNYKLQNDTVLLHCNINGIVEKLEGMAGEYAFRQVSKY